MMHVVHACVGREPTRGYSMPATSKRKHKQRPLAAAEPTTKTGQVIDRRDEHQNGQATAIGLTVVRSNGSFRLDLDHCDQQLGQAELMKALGIDDPVLCNSIARDLAGLAVNGKEISEQELNQHLAIVRGIEPTDAIEALLVVQMAGVHAATIRAAQRLKAAETIDQQDSASSMLNKLMRTFTMQVEALKRHRSGGEQNVIVKHVHVYPGGQAVVGNVKTSGKHQQLD